MKLSQTEIIGGIILIILIAGSSFLYFTTNKSFCGDSICQENEIKLCFADCDWCGDGLCQDNEKGECSLDCDWCGDNFCQQDESCFSCSGDCGDCEADAYCGDSVCNIGECEIGCTKDCSLLDCQNGICESELGENCVTAPNDCKCSINGKCNTKTKRCETVTCGNGICDSVENTKTCPADCKSDYIVEDTSGTNYPIIFVHGHSAENRGTTMYSINTFKEIQNKLDQGGLFEDKGIIIPSSNIDNLREGVWGEMSKPISIRTTYYKGHIESDEFVVGSEDEKSISEYAKRLKTVIDIVKHHTGKNKVILIAHSMGGLVSREYIRQNGASSVSKLITIGTPNHGVISGGNVFSPAFGCSIAHSGPECYEMDENSEFMVNLNKGDETPGSTDYLTITGKSKKGSVIVAGFLTYYPCGDTQTYHDEVVCSTKVSLEGAQNLVYEGQIYNHGDLVYPSKTPKVYNDIVKFLN